MCTYVGAEEEKGRKKRRVAPVAMEVTLAGHCRVRWVTEGEEAHEGGMVRPREEKHMDVGHAIAI